MASWNLVKIGSGNGLLPDGTISSPEPVMLCTVSNEPLRANFKFSSLSIYLWNIFSKMVDISFGPQWVNTNLCIVQPIATMFLHMYIMLDVVTFCWSSGDTRKHGIYSLTTIIGASAYTLSYMLAGRGFRALVVIIWNCPVLFCPCTIYFFLQMQCGGHIMRSVFFKILTIGTS